MKFKLPRTGFRHELVGTKIIKKKFLWLPIKVTERNGKGKEQFIRWLEFAEVNYIHDGHKWVRYGVV